MKNRKLCRLFAAVLAVAMVAAMIPVSALAGFTGWFSGWKGTIAEEETVETLATGSITQPFTSSRTFTSRYGDAVKRSYWRIPAIVTLDNGTIVAAADARLSSADCGGIDTAVAYSTDGGASWTGVMANYLGDDNGAYSEEAATFIDPALATDGKTVYMLVDLFSAGYSNMGYSSSNSLTVGLDSTGFTSDGHLRISKGGNGKASTNDSDYTYYLSDFTNESDEEAQRATIVASDGKTVEGYTVDRWFNLYDEDDDKVSNLFYWGAAYQAHPQQHLYFTKSEDGGATWSAPTLLNVKTKGDVFCGVGPGGGYVTSDGTIVFPLYDTVKIFGTLQASVVYSTDEGKTWTHSAGIGTDGTTSEATLSEVKLDKNYLYLFARGSAQAYFVAESPDTWTEKGSIPFSYGTDSALGSITYSQQIDGCPAIIFSAPTSTSHTTGVIYVGLVQADGTIDFKYDKDINSAYFKYSDLTELEDGRVALLYESDWSGGASPEITFKTFDISELCPNAKIGNVVEDDGDYGITVTARDLTSVSANKLPTFAVDGAEDGKVLAYEMTLNGGAYTGAAIVEFPLPDWGDVDTSRIRGFVQEENDNITTLAADVDEAAGTVTVEIPHFSNVGIFLAAEDAATYYEVITLKVDESEEVSIPDNNYKDAQNRTNLNESIATVKVVGTDAYKTDPVYESRSVSYSALAGSNTSWTKTDYYYKSDNDYYPVYAYRARRSNYGSYTYYYGYSTTDSSNNVNTLSSSYYSSGTVTVYEKTSEGTDIPASTTITFKGMAPGDTSVIVGETQYNIHVDKGTYTVALRPGASKTLAADYGTVIAVAPVENTIATAEKTAEGILITAGDIEGSTTMKTDLYIITITVADIIEVTDPALSPFVGGTTNVYMSATTQFPVSHEKQITKVTMTTGLNDGYDVDLASQFADQQVEWSVGDSSVVTVDEYGKITPVSPGETVLQATVNGVTYQMPVVVYEGPSEDNDYTFHIYVDKTYNCKVYYSYTFGELILAGEGNVFYGAVAKTGTSAFDFFGAPDEGYALTGMKSQTTDTRVTGEFFKLHDDNGNAVTDTTQTSYFASIFGSKFDGHRTEINAMIEAAVAMGCDGAQGFNSANGSINSFDPSAIIAFYAQKLPTVEKTLEGIYDKNGTRKTGDNASKVEIDDTVKFNITVTKPLTIADYGTITYSGVSVTDALTSSKYDKSVDQMGVSTTEDVLYTYITELKLTNENFATVVQDGKITNEVEVAYTYQAQFSKGSAKASASAAATVTVGVPTYVVDFGLPVEVDLRDVVYPMGYEITSATGAAASGYKITYTPDHVLDEPVYVSLNLKGIGDKNGRTAGYGVTIIPASNVLYEENFLTEVETKYGQSWTLNTDTAISEKQSNQLAKAEGDAYGYDRAYQNANADTRAWTISNLTKGQSSHRLDTSFNGNGFDLIGRCGPDTASVMLLISDADGKLVKGVYVDTRCNQEFDWVPLAHIMLDETANYTATVYAYYANETATSANAAAVQSVRAKSDDSFAALKRDLAELGLSVSDLEFIQLSDTMNASAQRVSVYSTMAETTSGRAAGTHMEIDAFRVYRETNDSNYAESEQNRTYERVLDYVTELVAYTESGSEYTIETYDSDTVGGPKNEIYLEKSTGESGHAVTFQVGNLDKIQVSLRSVDGEPVGVNGVTINSTTEMYYEITGENGVFTIVNTGDGILGIGNLKLPVDATIQTASELEPEVVSYSLRMALAVEPDQPEEPEQPEVFLPQSFNASCRSVNVLRNKLVTVSVTASTDVAYITVNGQKVNAWNNALGWIYQPDTLRFTFTDLIKRGESKTYEIVAYNADGVASAVYTVQG